MTDEAVAPERVASLIAAGTEIVAALGASDRLVARSHECGAPGIVGQRPAVTRPAFDPAGSSREIDERVRAAAGRGRGAERALGIYDVDFDALAALAPDLIVTQAQCAVCAVSLAAVERAVADRLPVAPRVVSLEAETLAGVEADVRNVGAALGAPDRAEALVRGMRARREAVSHALRGVPERPSVGFFEWIDPLIPAGHWTGELIELAGGADAFADRRGERMVWEELAAADPDVLVFAPCGWGLGTARDEVAAWTGRQGWSGLSAVRAGRVALADGNRYFNRPGPALAASLEILAEILHPDRLRWGWHDAGWRPLISANS